MYPRISQQLPIFAREDEVSEKDPEGAGPGMSLVKRMIE